MFKALFNPYNYYYVGGIKHGVKRYDPIGETFGNVTVLSYSHSIKSKHYYNCKCLLCGKEFVTAKEGLISGHTKSCGCVRDKWMHSGNLNRKHGLSNDRAYWVWAKIKSRCYNPNCREYPNYGGRGIKMCDEWLDPKNFVEWAYANGYDKDAPKGQCTIDRINVDGNYEPSNCRFITNQEQQNNRRDCHFIEYQGEVHTIADWARKFNVPYPTLRNALMLDGKTIEQFITNYKPHVRRK